MVAPRPSQGLASRKPATSGTATSAAGRADRRFVWAGLGWCQLLVTWAVLHASASDADRRVLGTTLALAGGTVLGSLPWGCLLAWFLVKVRVRGRRLAAAAVAAAVLLPLYLYAASWDAGFGKLGWYTVPWNENPAVADSQVANSQVVNSQVADPLEQAASRAFAKALVVHVIAAIPWVAVLVATGLRYVPRELEEQAWLEGSAAQVFTRVTWPRLQGMAVVAGSWVFLLVAGEMTVTDLYQVRTFAEEVYTGFALAEDPLTAGWSTIWLIHVASLLVAAALTIISLLPPAGETPPAERWRWRPRRVGKGITWLFLAGSLLLLWGVPLVNLVYKAGVQVVPQGEQFVRLWSFAKVWRLTLGWPGDFAEAAWWRYRAEYGWTGWISIGTALVTLGAAAPLGFVARRRVAMAVPLGLAAAFLLAVPGPQLSVWLVALTNSVRHPWLIYLVDDTVLVPVLAMSLRAFPLVALICWAGFRTLPETWFEAARLEGGSFWSVFWRLGVSSRRELLAVAAFAAWALAVGDLAASIQVLPAGMLTITVRVFDLLHSGVDDMVAAVCLLNLVVFLALGLVCLRRSAEA